MFRGKKIGSSTCDNKPERVYKHTLWWECRHQQLAASWTIRLQCAISKQSSISAQGPEEETDKKEW